MPEPTDPLADNLRLWQAWTKIHVGSEFYDVPSFVDGSNSNRLREYEIAEVGDVAGKSLLHLQCHFGLDTLSWARLGARVTGADFSPAAIDAARALAAEVGIDARFVVSNLYELPSNLHGSFDVVYTSRGVLGWLPDIHGWAKVAAHFVKPGGIFYVTEIHPVVQVFDDDSATVRPGDLRLKFPYWEHTEPISFEVSGSYADRDAPTEGLVEHGWNHSLGEIVTALVDAGLAIDFLHEFDFAEWEVPILQRGDEDLWRLPGDVDGTLPLFFSIRASKPATR